MTLGPAVPTTPAQLRATVEAAVPDLQVVDLIGEGTGGRVLRARLGDKDVAVKCLPAHTPERRRRSDREEQMLAAAQGSHVVRLLQSVPGDDVHFLILEYIGDGVLSDYESLRWSAADITALALSAAEPLGRLHRQGLQFNDVKPANLGVARHGDRWSASLLDFGHANTIEDSRSVPFIAGTVHYVAPEIVRPGQPGPWSDIYSLGVILHMLARGSHPGRLPSFDLLFALGPPPIQPVAEVTREPLPPQLAQILDSCVAVDCADRPQDGSALAAQLRGLAETEGPHFLAAARWIP